MTQPAEQQIREFNKSIQKAAQMEEDRHDKEMTRLVRALQAPCEWCKYDGVLRCSTCEENFYEGFNIKHYPD